jgi:hypothetical protein
MDMGGISSPSTGSGEMGNAIAAGAPFLFAAGAAVARPWPELRPVHSCG